MLVIELINTFLRQASASGSRANALNPLTWALGITLAALMTAIEFQAAIWLTMTLTAFAGLFVFALLFAYAYLLIKDRDALRSERFTLSKMAIQRSITGDNLAGFIEDPEKHPATLPTIEKPE